MNDAISQPDFISEALEKAANFRAQKICREMW